MEIDTIYAEHGHHTFFDFWLFGNDVKGLSDEEFVQINEAALEWGRTNEIPCELTKLDDGFRVEIVHLSESCEGIGSSLFMTLAKGVFRNIERGFAYGAVRETGS